MLNTHCVVLCPERVIRWDISYFKTEVTITGAGTGLILQDRPHLCQTKTSRNQSFLRDKAGSPESGKVLVNPVELQRRSNPT